MSLKHKNVNDYLKIPQINMIFLETIKPVLEITHKLKPYRSACHDEMSYNLLLEYI